MQKPIIDQLHLMRQFYNAGVTRPYVFRKEQLRKLKAVILKFEQNLYDALYVDLKKNKEESYATEVGLLMAEINVALKNLHSWMEPQRARTDLANFPSTSKIYRDSLGVVFIVAPWNYPLQLLLIPLVGAIAGGNCVVLKPSELAPATSSVIEKIISTTFDGRYIKVIEGDGAIVVPEMMNTFRFDYVFYTGSIQVGKIIYQLAAEKLVPVTLELGGKSPAIVEADADIVTSAKRIVMGKFLNVGQTCIAPDYLLVHESVKEELVERIKSLIEKFYTADASSAYDFGKIVNERRFNKLVSYLSEGNILAGGQYDKSKLFIAPTLIDNVSLDAPVMREEIFGPVLPVHTFRNMDEAMQIVQRNADPLAFYLFTSSKKKENEWINKISFGGGCINNADWHFTNHHLPFGGVGNSGMGAYHGKYTFDTFTRLKPVMKTPTWFDPSFKYPSFRGKLKLFKWFIR